MFNVLSLFDGMGCGKVALERAGIKVDNYYASEIDKYAIQVSETNHPDIIQLGDINNWNDWKLPKIDLIIGGSPCQGFSFAGKQLNFDDPRSKLFFEFVKVLEHYKPKYFLLENVKMKQEYQDIISNELGVNPVEINSALVSAQNRKRLYWTNIPNLTLPEDKGIVLKNIVLDESEKIGAFRGRYLVNGKRQDHKMKTAGLTKQRLEIRKDYKSNSLTTVQKDNVLCKMIGMAELNTYDVRRRVYSIEGKSPTLTTSTGGYHAQKIPISDIEWRYLTPIEYERLQTLPDNYTEGVSNTQRYKMLGNGWTIDVVAHIMKGIK